MNIFSNLFPFFRKTFPHGNSTDKQKFSTFNEFMNKSIEQSGLRSSTILNHKQTLHLLSEFNHNIHFKELTSGFLSDFEKFMVDRMYHRNTIAKHFRQLKRYINLAIDNNYLSPTKYPFRKFKIKTIDTKRQFLSPEELAAFEQLSFPEKPNLQLKLDLFLFCCYTGLRFSDVIRISEKDFQFSGKTVWLELSTLKTTSNIKLPLSLLFQGKALKIYNRYKHNKPTIFQVRAAEISNINKFLLSLCKKGRLNKRISFHSSRHTFATLLLYQGVHLSSVQKLLGHKSIRTTEIYASVIDQTIINDLKRANKK